MLYYNLISLRLKLHVIGVILEYFLTLKYKAQLTYRHYRVFDMLVNPLNRFDESQAWNYP